MYHYFIAIIFIFTSCSTNRVTEKSEKKRPNWVYGLATDYIIVEGNGPNHETAKNAALRLIKEKIVQSVAVNVEASTTYLVNEQSINKISNYQEKFQSQVRITSTLIPILSGISLNKASAFYWEVIKKERKERVVNYHVMYPFSQIEQSALIGAWQDLDRQLAQEIQILAEQLSEVNRISSIQEILNKANVLADLFVEPRKSQAIMLANRARDLLDNAYIHIEANVPGELVFSILANGRKLRPEQTIVLENECIGQYQTTWDALLSQTRINYDDHFCQSVNMQDLRLIVEQPAFRKTKSIPIPSFKDQARIQIREPIRFLPRNNQSSLRDWVLTIRSMNEIPFTIIDIELTVERLNLRTLANLSGSATRFFAQHNKPLDFVGKNDFLIRIPSDFKENEFDNLVTGLLNKRIEMQASCKITYLSKGNKQPTTIQFNKIAVDVK